MTLDSMKIWRLFTPAALMLIYGALLVYILNGYTLALPDFSQSPYLVILIVPAVLYYITPLRTFVNMRSHERITENLRSGIVRISGFSDNKSIYTWVNIRSLFYKLVDQDKSLSTKASLAYFNGLIWTGFADSVAISILYSTLCLLLLFLGSTNALLALLIFIVIAVISLYGNKIATERQINIGDEQLEHMRFEHKAAIQERLKQLVE